MGSTRSERMRPRSAAALAPLRCLAQRRDACRCNSPSALRLASLLSLGSSAALYSIAAFSTVTCPLLAPDLRGRGSNRLQQFLGVDRLDQMQVEPGAVAGIDVVLRPKSG